MQCGEDAPPSRHVCCFVIVLVRMVTLPTSECIEKAMLPHAPIHLSSFPTAARALCCRAAHRVLEGRTALQCCTTHTAGLLLQGVPTSHAVGSRLPS